MPTLNENFNICDPKEWRKNTCECFVTQNSTPQPAERFSRNKNEIVRSKVSYFRLAKITKKFHVVQMKQPKNTRGEKMKRKYMMMWHPLFLLFALMQQPSINFRRMLPDKIVIFIDTRATLTDFVPLRSCREKEWHFNRNRIILSFTIFYSSEWVKLEPKDPFLSYVFWIIYHLFIRCSPVWFIFCRRRCSFVRLIIIILNA